MSPLNACPAATPWAVLCLDRPTATSLLPWPVVQRRPIRNHPQRTGAITAPRLPQRCLVDVRAVVDDLANHSPVVVGVVVNHRDCLARDTPCRNVLDCLPNGWRDSGPSIPCRRIFTAAPSRITHTVSPPVVPATRHVKSAMGRNDTGHAQNVGKKRS